VPAPRCCLGRRPVPHKQATRSFRAPKVLYFCPAMRGAPRGAVTRCDGLCHAPEDTLELARKRAVGTPAQLPRRVVQHAASHNQLL